MTSSRPSSTCHPERSHSRTSPATQSKDLRLLLPVLVLLLTTITLKAPAQKTTAKFSGESAYRITQQFLAVAPHRWIGSPGHAKAEEFIKAHFKKKPPKATSRPTPSPPALQSAS